MSKNHHSTNRNFDETGLMDTIARKSRRDHATGVSFGPTTRREMLAVHGFRNYEAYVQSEAWHLKRDELFKTGMPTTCVICEASPVILHHVNYRHVTREFFNDVIPVCERHHHDIHEYLKLLKVSTDLTFHVIRLMMRWSVRQLNFALANYHVALLADQIGKATGLSPTIIPTSNGKRVHFVVDGRRFAYLDIGDGSVKQAGCRHPKPVRQFVQDLGRRRRPE